MYHTIGLDYDGVMFWKFNEIITNDDFWPKSIRNLGPSVRTRGGRHSKNYGLFCSTEPHCYLSTFSISSSSLSLKWTRHRQRIIVVNSIVNSIGHRDRDWACDDHRVIILLQGPILNLNIIWLLVGVQSSQIGDLFYLTKLRPVQMMLRISCDLQWKVTRQKKSPFCMQWPVMDQLTANSQQIATSLKEP